MSHCSTKKILTLGNYRESITVIRSLSTAGFDIIVGRDNEKTFTQYSRHTSEVWQHPHIRDEEGFLSAFLRLLTQRDDLSFVFPIGDSFLEYFARHIDKIPSRSKLIMPDSGIVAICLNKSKMYRLISELKLPLPETRIVYSMSELVIEAERIHYPCVIKAENSLKPFYGKKAIISVNREETAKNFTSWPEDNGFLIVQKYLPGYRRNCHFAAFKGEIWAYFEQKVLRTNRVDYTGYGVDGISVSPTPVLEEHCATLVRNLEYSGVGCVQFLVDESNGSVGFLELNPRLDATCALPYRCGYDFPRMAVECVERMGGVIGLSWSVRPSYRLGKRAHWLLGDIRGLQEAIEGREVDMVGAVGWFGNLVKTLVQADFHLTWSWKDPVPTFFLYAELMMSVWRRVKQISKLVITGISEKIRGSWYRYE